MTKSSSNCPHGHAMTELLPRPRREDFSEYYGQFDCAERDYYKRLAEFAIASMKDASKDKLNTHFILKDALSTIKGSRDEN